MTATNTTYRIIFDEDIVEDNFDSLDDAMSRFAQLRQGYLECDISQNARHTALLPNTRYVVESVTTQAVHEFPVLEFSTVERAKALDKWNRWVSLDRARKQGRIAAEEFRSTKQAGVNPYAASKDASLIAKWDAGYSDGLSSSHDKDELAAYEEGAGLPFKRWSEAEDKFAKWDKEDNWCNFLRDNVRDDLSNLVELLKSNMFSGMVTPEVWMEESSISDFSQGFKEGRQRWRPLNDGEQHYFCFAYSIGERPKPLSGNPFNNYSNAERYTAWEYGYIKGLRDRERELSDIRHRYANENFPRGEQAAEDSLLSPLPDESS